MDAVNDDDEGMMAMMGMTGFGSTKVLTSISLPYYFLKVIPLARANTSKEIKTALPTSRNHGHGDNT
jgi:hypothetical protein